MRYDSHENEMMVIMVRFERMYIHPFKTCHLLRVGIQENGFSVFLIFIILS